MSRWLVDTHALLWFLADDLRLSQAARETMEDASEALLVSCASWWEIALKSSLGKLEVPDDLPEIAVAEGFVTLDITCAHAWEVRRLPVTGHKDPFDRMVAAQARVEGVGAISGDRQLDAYGVARRW